MTDVRLHPHAKGRLDERGTTEAEVIATLNGGEIFPAKFGRFDGQWRSRYYATKQIEAFAVEEDGWLGITVIVKFF